jgi:hypothetical protein
LPQDASGSSIVLPRAQAGQGTSIANRVMALIMYV